jgi:hypothetical protein
MERAPKGYGNTDVSYRGLLKAAKAILVRMVILWLRCTR